METLAFGMLVKPMHVTLIASHLHYLWESRWFLYLTISHLRIQYSRTLGLYSLESRRMSGDPIQKCKILSRHDRADAEMFGLEGKS